MGKEEARAAVQPRLDFISDGEYVARSLAAYKNAEALFDRLCLNGEADSVLLYAALPYWREVPLSSLKKKYAGSLFEYASSHKDAPLPAKKYNIIFVPLYGFSSDGYRLGHGGGWYDRMLAAQPQALKIGVGVEAGHVEFAPESHDIPMDALVTEGRCEILRKRRRH